MDIINNFPERRKYKRFKLKGPAFAIISYSPIRTGQIIDIGKGGLALQYEKNFEGANLITDIEIFKSDLSFYIDNIKAKTVSDIEIIDPSFSQTKETTKMRRCGIKFRDLSSHQISQLVNFIQHFTFAEH